MKNKYMKLNESMIAKELKEVYGLIYTIIKNKCPITGMDGAVYLNVIIIEVVKYLNEHKNINLEEKMKYKKICKTIRGRIKNDEMPFDDKVRKIEAYQITQLKEMLPKHYTDTNIVNSSVFANNLGVFYINEQAISNTFQGNYIYKKLLKKGTLDKQELYNFGKEQIKILVELINSFPTKSTININQDLAIKCQDKDFNTISRSDEIFKKTVNTEVALCMLDMVCKINFYKEVISNILPPNSTLRYRIAYIMWNTIYLNLESMSKSKSFIASGVDIEKYNSLIKDQSLFDNKTFRNCMFHYDLSNVIKEEYFGCHKMFFGLIEQEFGVSEAIYVKKIESMLDVIVKQVENDILIKQKSFKDF